MAAGAAADRPRVVGLTGGIGSGKSTAARLLGGKGALVIDVDLVCREVIEPGGPAHEAVLARFGRHLVGSDGRLDRAALASVVFGDPAALADLTGLSHPAANVVMAERVAAAPADSVVVLDMAVLAEYPRLGRWGPESDGAGDRDGYRRVVVVEAPVEVRLERLAQQRGMAADDARARMAAQVGDDERRRLADHVLDNGGDEAHLAAQVDVLWPELLGGN